jgi:hypothetical protein
VNHPNPVADADDWITVARYADPTQAMVVQGCLQAAGVPVAVADVHTLQMHALLAGAIPARVQAPSRWEPQALAVLAAFERGDFALSDAEILQATQPNEPKESGDDNTV